MERKGIHTNVASELKRRDVVCIYSQADEAFYLQLKKSLKLLERAGEIRWSDVFAGEEAATVWQREVTCADLILLLLSPDFFADELCYQTMHLALQEQTSRQVPVVPILVRAVNWRLSACKNLDIVPRNEQPIASWSLPDEAYASIGTDLVRLVPGWPPIPLPTRPRLFQARDLPKGHVPRPKAFDEIKHLLLNREGGQTTSITTALRGAGGFGKTTLALALCHDVEVQAAFPDGILWIELGEQPLRPLDVLNGVLASLDTSLSGTITLEEARERWQTALRDRVFLLVIDDVWQAEALLLLLEGGPQCVRLITTRNDVLLPRYVARVLVDAMEPHEAIAVLCQGLPKAISQTASQLNQEALAARLGYWPLLLTLANGLLTELVDAHLSLTEALATIAEAYQTRGVTAFRLDNVEERQRTVDGCLRVSMQHLETFTPTHYHALARYQELVIFPEDTDIPLSTLQIYWKGNAGLEPWECKDLCMRLHRLSLLLICDLGKGTIRLHDVLHSYLVQRAGSHLPEMHTQLLNVYRQVLHLARWADLPPNESYLWQHLIWHLCQAGHMDALTDTLTDQWYLIRKTLVGGGIAALEADLLRASTWQHTDSVEPVSSLFALLHRDIVHISHLLRQVETEAEMGGLLLSHLGSYSFFVAHRAAWEHELPRPFLTNWHPLPNEASSTLLRTLLGHASSVTYCTVSPDSRFIVSSSDDGTLKVWNATTGAECLTLKGHSDAVGGCAVSPDSRFIVSASDDQTLKVWNATTGAECLTLKGHRGRVRGCAVSPDSRFIVSASDDQTLKVWNATTGAEHLTLKGHISDIHRCAFSPDGRFIVSASGGNFAEKALKVWDAATGSERLSLKSHTYLVSDCAFSPDGRLIVSASDDGTLKLWDATTGAELFTFKGHTHGVLGCAFSPDGCFIVSASSDKTLKVWNAISRTEHLTLHGHTDKVLSCAFSPDRCFIVSASADRTLKVWDAFTGAKHLALKDHDSSVLSCAFSPDGRFAVSASEDNRTLKVWDAFTGTERLALKDHANEYGFMYMPVEHAVCAVSPDGRFIVSVSADGTLVVWTTTGTKHLTFRGPGGYIYCGAMSSDGRFIVAGCADGTLVVWDAITGAELFTLKDYPRLKAVEHAVCAVSPDGSFIISAFDDNNLTVWDTTTRAKHLILRSLADRVLSCATSSDGRFIVAGCANGTLVVWDVTFEMPRLMFIGHTGRVLGCAVSPDGHWVISVSSDHTLKVWEIPDDILQVRKVPNHTLRIRKASGWSLRGLAITVVKCSLTFPVEGELRDCAFHPDGKHLIACGKSGMYFLRLER